MAREVWIANRVRRYDDVGTENSDCVRGHTFIRDGYLLYYLLKRVELQSRTVALRC